MRLAYTQLTASTAFHNGKPRLLRRLTGHPTCRDGWSDIAVSGEMYGEKTGDKVTRQ